MSTTEIKHLSQLDGVDLECPVCNHRFDQKQQLIEHASEHAKTRRHRSYDSNPAKPYKCPKCWKAFTIEERLQRHMLCHGDEAAKPLECTVSDNEIIYFEIFFFCNIFFYCIIIILGFKFTYRYIF